MTDVHGPFMRDYRAGRREYGLPADLALAYARQRRRAWEAELTVAYALDPLEPDAIGVLLVDDEERVVASVGGVDVGHQVSDHGNLNLDERDPYLVWLVAELLDEATA